jgi:release factor glutamine methyltransferase
MKKNITIADLQKEYFGKIDQLDLDLIISAVLKKPREFVLAHPEYKIPSLKIKNLKFKILRRMRSEPLAYILGFREFYGLNFKVTTATLIPRPETELLIDEILKLNPQNNNIIDVGTGSGNIIISLAKNISNKNSFFGIDISKEALKIAKQNSRNNRVSEKIKFSQGSLLDKIKNINNSIIIANLPYLSQEIYSATLPTVKKYEPKSALYSPQKGLWHYTELLKQITKLNPIDCIIFLEISPEQKIILPKLIKKYLPQAQIEFKKDLTSRWRICKIRIN